MKAERAQELRMAIDRLPLTTRRAMLKGIEKNPIIVGADASISGGLCPILAASGSATQVGRPFARAWDRYARARLPRPATERELLTLRAMLDTSIAREQQTPFSLGGALVSHKVAERRNRPRQGAGTRRQAGHVAREAAVHSETRRDAREAAREVRQALRDLRRAPRNAEPQIQVAPRPEPEPEVRYSAEYLQPAARVAAVKAKARAKAQAEAQAKARAEAEAQAEAEASRRRPADTHERDRTWELAGRNGWSWLRPVRRYDDYEQTLLDLERELEAVEREGASGFDDSELITSAPGRG